MGYLYVLSEAHMQKLLCSNFSIGWNVDFSVRVVWEEAELILGGKGGILKEFWDGFGSYLQWKKCREREEL